MTLLEVLLALVLLGISLLAVAPMFIAAMQVNSAGGKLGSSSALALERMEQLRAEPFNNLVIGGSLTSNVAGYSDMSTQDFVVRWKIDPNAVPPNTLLITVRASPLASAPGPGTDLVVTTLRGN